MNGRSAGGSVGCARACGVAGHLRLRVRVVARRRRDRPLPARRGGGSPSGVGAGRRTPAGHRRRPPHARGPRTRRRPWSRHETRAMVIAWGCSATSAATIASVVEIVVARPLLVRSRAASQASSSVTSRIRHIRGAGSPGSLGGDLRSRDARQQADGADRDVAIGPVGQALPLVRVAPGAGLEPATR
jgi:hypothetical protein